MMIVVLVVIMEHEMHMAINIFVHKSVGGWFCRSELGVVGFTPIPVISFDSVG